jgi:hypothetical protein
MENLGTLAKDKILGWLRGGPLDDRQLLALCIEEGLLGGEDGRPAWGLVRLVGDLAAAGRIDVESLGFRRYSVRLGEPA